MTVIVELPDELAKPLENKASELNVDASHFIAALVREKLRLPVKDSYRLTLLDYELEREPGESEEDYEAAKSTFDTVFKAALSP